MNTQHAAAISPCAPTHSPLSARLPNSALPHGGAVLKAKASATMKLNDIRDNDGARKGRMRVGRGIGSGKGKTAARGQKGQKSRSGVAIKGFEGGQMPLVRRLPKRGFTNIFRKTWRVVNLKSLAVFGDGAIVDVAALEARGVIQRNKAPVKVLGEGDAPKNLTLQVTAASASAIKKIEDAGGKVEIVA